ncbi:MAG TPA: nucleotidyl transferase AbiEii/AbiGii toxin family protein, partial [Acidothermaceae bacterium]|nr:nucleotidyl transferase AbiEii/AbiGii toxin family protein [Acidothermaceae bacterium]
FCGGTALARAFLPDGRLSEDIDLISIGPRGAVAATLDDVLATGARRRIGAATWQPALSEVRPEQPAQLLTRQGTIKVQLLTDSTYEPWPTEYTPLHQRYADAAEAILQVPTRPAFAAWKTVTWGDRHAARDLWDLQALAVVDAIDQAAAALYRRHGPTGGDPGAWLFDRLPSSAEWTAALAGQTRLAITAAEAAEVVREAWAIATR